MHRGAMSLGEGALNQNQSVIRFFWALRHLILPLLLVTMLPQAGLAQSPSSRPVQLKCDALVNPLGIDSKAPMLSWQLRYDRFGARQRAYEIQVDRRGRARAQARTRSRRGLGDQSQGRELPSFR